MTQVPRYTSYPTAPHFHDGINCETYTSWLGDMRADSAVSLYFHVPFCQQLCWFCGCHTKVINQYRPVGHYLDVVRREADLLAPYVSRSKVSHIHFGGGSPSIITPDDFQSFMEGMRQRFSFSPDIEIAIELDPRTTDENKISAYALSGVNRVSIGAQDFSEDVQRAINRLQPYNMVEKTTIMLREKGIHAINIDLVYGLPHQNLDTIENSITKTLQLNPDRIALFGYAHVPWMRKHQQLIDEDKLPDEENRAEMREYAGQLLQQSGYVPVGIDHFAKPDDPLSVAYKEKRLKRNFQGYTTDGSDYLLGLGASSISSLPHGYGQNNGDVGGYRKAILKGELPIIRGISLSAQDRRRRDIIMSLMCAMPVKVSQHLYGPELQKLAPFIKNGVAHYDGETLSVSPHAHHDLRIIASIFDQYLQGTRHLHSQAV